MSVAVVFPGQGSQYVGMGRDIYESDKKAKELIDRADLAVPGLRKIMFEGPEEELKKTDITQPAILVHSAAVYEMIKQKLRGETAFFAGHSLGEYSALYAAGAFDFETAVRFVRRRGELMQAASEKAESTMAAIIGLDEAKVRELCEKVKEAGYLALANINSPVQIVVSGDVKAVDAAEAAAKELGAKRYIKLSVAGAFHSEIMKDAANGLGEEIEGFTVNYIDTPVIANVTARPVKSAGEIKEALIKQVVSPVRWVESVEYMKEEGADVFVEAGPGAVLSGLIKKIDRSVKVYNIGKAEDVKKIDF